MPTVLRLNQLTRKPATWAEVGELNFNDLLPQVQLALTRLPVLHNVSTGPMDLYDDPIHAIASTAQEVLVQPSGTESVFYVNNEGFKYARYAVRLVNYPHYMAL